MATAIRFYLDEHVPRAVANGLRLRGVDVVTVADAEMLGSSDRDHMAWANAQGRVVFTQDDDFLKLHAESVEHAGIVYAPQGRAVGEIVHGLLLVRQVLTADEMRGHLEFL